MFARLLIGTLLLGLLISGCSRAKFRTEEVSGKVTYKGKPLPGGVVMFLAADESRAAGYAGTGNIDPESGSYTLQAPVGEVRVSVDNRILKKGGHIIGDIRQGRKPPSHVKVEEPPPAPTIPGTYVSIPEKYSSPEESGLKYTVTSPGPQTYNIELK